MSSKKILIVSGTHGNEINPIWAVNKFIKSEKINSSNDDLIFAKGNPLAINKGFRYLDFDLNRSFNRKVTNINKDFYELKRAEFLMNEYGISGLNPCQIALDFHTTTSAMGTSIVMYGRRKYDFCLAAILQNKFGLPIYLHEKDKNQTGFLVEAWPCGLVIEIGPVAQNYYDPQIIERFIIILQFLYKTKLNPENICLDNSSEITFFVHQYSIDYPRDEKNNVKAVIHPKRLNQDWNLIQEGDPLFLDNQGKTVKYTESDIVYPVFIGEAAYKEKNIAMSFTKKEILEIPQSWFNSFFNK